jgi:hypothetical protein
MAALLRLPQWAADPPAGASLLPPLFRATSHVTGGHLAPLSLTYLWSPSSSSSSISSSSTFLRNFNATCRAEWWAPCLWFWWFRLWPHVGLFVRLVVQKCGAQKCIRKPRIECPLSDSTISPARSLVTSDMRALCCCRSMFSWCFLSKCSGVVRLTFLRW